MGRNKKYTDEELLRILRSSTTITGAAHRLKATPGSLYQRLHEMGLTPRDVLKEKKGRNTIDHKMLKKYRGLVTVRDLDPEGASFFRTLRVLRTSVFRYCLLHRWPTPDCLPQFKMFVELNKCSSLKEDPTLLAEAVGAPVSVALAAIRKWKRRR